MEAIITVPKPRATQHLPHNMNQAVSATKAPAQSKYAQLLNVIEELGRDIRPSYAGSRSSGERIKRAIMHARVLVRECIAETEKCAKERQ